MSLNVDGSFTPRSCSEVARLTAFDAIHCARAALGPRPLPPGVALLVTGSHARNDAVSARGIEVILVGRGNPLHELDSRDPPSSMTLEKVKEMLYSPSIQGPTTSTTRFSEVFLSEDTDLMDVSFCIATPGEGLMSETPHLTSETPCRSSTTKEIAIHPELAEKATVIRQIIQQHPHIFSPILDVFQLDGIENPLRCYNGREYRTMPSRALDAILLEGDLEVFKQYRCLAFQDLVTLNSKRRRDFERQLVEPAKQEFSECMQGKALQPVDYRKGILHFDGDRILSTKYVFLRPIQYHMMDLLMHYIHGKETLAEKFSKEMPTSIADRIQWMHDRKIISQNTSVDALRSTYLKALS